MGSISLRNASLVVGNGRGKTTLLRAMAGQGDIVCSHGLQIGYVEKDMPAACMNMTLHEMVLAALPATDRDTDSWRVDVVLDEFETPEALRQRPLSQLGGGWQRIALIAQCWALQPDALLLDEPTNHLDLGRLFQLENWFNQAARNIPVVIASHDRQFLDAMTARTLFSRPEA
ncbi:MAG: ATP-binding cassette domain-containing protein, partial [Candidatus Devosia euplotis]|nr:ATP-binding cassette domain-containing protein [Candidatus Devosia euplotis]